MTITSVIVEYLSFVALNIIFGIFLQFFGKYGEARRLGLISYVFGLKWIYAFQTGLAMFLIFEAFRLPFFLANHFDLAKRIVMESRPWVRIVLMIAFVILFLWFRLRRSILFAATQASIGLSACWMAAYTAKTDDPNLFVLAGLGSGLYLAVDGLFNLREFYISKTEGSDILNNIENNNKRY